MSKDLERMALPIAERLEAAKLFHYVRQPDEDEQALADAIHDMKMQPGDEPILQKLSVGDDDENSQAPVSAKESGKGPAGGESNLTLLGRADDQSPSQPGARRKNRSEP